MKIKTLLVTLLFAVSMGAQTAAPTPVNKSSNTKATASCCKDGAACCGKDKMAKADCCKDGAACCKDGAGCCGKDKMAKADGKNCCGGKMCQRHKAEKS
jgi:hypothetical protein